MVMVKIDSNYVLVQPMKNKLDKEMIGAYQALMTRLQEVGVVTKKYVLDNEYSENLKKMFWDTCKLKVVSPGCHQCNIAEVAIKAFKPHFLRCQIFLSVISTCLGRFADSLQALAFLKMKIIAPPSASSLDVRSWRSPPKLVVSCS